MQWNELCKVLICWHYWLETYKLKQLVLQLMMQGSLRKVELMPRWFDESNSREQVLWQMAISFIFVVTINTNYTSYMHKY
jgi:hypothetical protein